VAEYRLLTIWHIEAPLEQVYAAILDSQHWPDWWPGVLKVEQAATGDADGINNVRRYSLQGKLPYRLAFKVCTTRIEKLVSIEGIAQGDLDGIGRWQFSREGTVSIVRCEWHVRTTRWWMNLIAPVARPMFIRNHALLMAQGGESLAHLLKSPLVFQEHIDLMEETVPTGVALWRLRERGRIDPTMALVTGLSAGVVATVAQLALWWLADMPVTETLFRDVRLTAALVMGTKVLPPPLTPQWDILLVATMIHFALSVAYALIPAHFSSRLRTGPALFAGALYGLAIYVVNLYGLTLLFPWFAITRDWVTLATHLVFGVTLAAGCRLFSAKVWE
jgi:Polyketide cyclase / dehydrase and lipid transport